MKLETLVVGPVQANCYIIGCEETGIGAVIDPGDDADQILKTLNWLNLKISNILLTHAHFDHFGAAKAIADATGAPVALHRADLPLLEFGGGATTYGLPKPPYHHPDIWLDEGDKIDIGTLQLEVLFTPGHSPGHVTFFERAKGLLFAGDVLFAGSIGRTDLPGGSYEVLMDNITRKLMTLPDETVLYPGHGTSTTIGHERQNNPFL